MCVSCIQGVIPSKCDNRVHFLGLGLAVKAHSEPRQVCCNLLGLLIGLFMTDGAVLHALNPVVAMMGERVVRALYVCKAEAGALLQAAHWLTHLADETPTVGNALSGPFTEAMHPGEQQLRLRQMRGTVAYKLEAGNRSISQMLFSSAPSELPLHTANLQGPCIRIRRCCCAQMHMPPDNLNTFTST